MQIFKDHLTGTLRVNTGLSITRERFGLLSRGGETFGYEKPYGLYSDTYSTRTTTEPFSLVRKRPLLGIDDLSRPSWERDRY